MYAEIGIIITTFTEQEKNSIKMKNKRKEKNFNILNKQGGKEIVNCEILHLKDVKALISSIHSRNKQARKNEY